MEEVLRFTVYGRPSTAKNGRMPISVNRGGKRFTVFAAKPALKRWETDALKQITGRHRLGIDYPVNVAVRVWTKENRRADLVGYLQAVDDMLTKAGIIADDAGWNPRIVATHDGSTIAGVDKKDPRVEITITKEELKYE